MADHLENLVKKYKKRPRHGLASHMSLVSNSEHTPSKSATVSAAQRFAYLRTASSSLRRIPGNDPEFDSNRTVSSHGETAAGKAMVNPIDTTKRQPYDWDKELCDKSPRILHASTSAGGTDSSTTAGENSGLEGRHDIHALTILRDTLANSSTSSLALEVTQHNTSHGRTPRDIRDPLERQDSISSPVESDNQKLGRLATVAISQASKLLSNLPHGGELSALQQAATYALANTNNPVSRSLASTMSGLLVPAPFSRAHSHQYISNQRLAVDVVKDSVTDSDTSAGAKAVLRQLSARQADIEKHGCSALTITAPSMPSSPTSVERSMNVTSSGTEQHQPSKDDAQTSILARSSVQAEDEPTVGPDTPSLSTSPRSSGGPAGLTAASYSSPGPGNELRKALTKPSRAAVVAAGMTASHVHLEVSGNQQLTGDLNALLGPPHTPSKTTAQVTSAAILGALNYSSPTSPRLPELNHSSNNGQICTDTRVTIAQCSCPVHKNGALTAILSAPEVTAHDVRDKIRQDREAKRRAEMEAALMAQIAEAEAEAASAEADAAAASEAAAAQEAALLERMRDDLADLESGQPREQASPLPLSTLTLAPVPEADERTEVNPDQAPTTDPNSSHGLPSVDDEGSEYEDDFIGDPELLMHTGSVLMQGGGEDGGGVTTPTDSSAAALDAQLAARRKLSSAYLSRLSDQTRVAAGDLALKIAQIKKLLEARNQVPESESAAVELERAAQNFVDVALARISALESRRNALKTRAEAFRRVAQARQQALLARNHALKLARAGLQSRIEECDALQRERDALLAAVDVDDASLSSTRAKARMLENDVSRLRKQVAQGEQALKTMESRLKIAEETASRCQRDYNQSEKVVTQLQDLVASTMVRLSRAEALLAASDAKVAQLTAQVNEQTNLLASTGTIEGSTEGSTASKGPSTGSFQYHSDAPLSFERIIEALTGMSRRTAMKASLETKRDMYAVMGISPMEAPPSQASTNQQPRSSMTPSTNPVGHATKHLTVPETDLFRIATHMDQQSGPIASGTLFDLETAARLVLQAVSDRDHLSRRKLHCEQSKPEHELDPAHSSAAHHHHHGGAVHATGPATAAVQTLLNVAITSSPPVVSGGGSAISNAQMGYTASRDLKDRFAAILLATAQPLARAKTHALQYQLRHGQMSGFVGLINTRVPVGSPPTPVPAANPRSSVAIHGGQGGSVGMTTNAGQNVGAGSATPLSNSPSVLSLPLSVIAAALYECDALIGSLVSRELELTNVTSELTRVKSSLEFAEKSNSETQARYNVTLKRMTEYEQGFEVARRATNRLKKQQEELQKQLKDQEEEFGKERASLLGQLRESHESVMELQNVVETLKSELASAREITEFERRRAQELFRRVQQSGGLLPGESFATLGLAHTLPALPRPSSALSPSLPSKLRLESQSSVGGSQGSAQTKSTAVTDTQAAMMAHSDPSVTPTNDEHLQLVNSLRERVKQLSTKLALSELELQSAVEAKEREGKEALAEVNRKLDLTNRKLANERIKLMEYEAKASQLETSLLESQKQHEAAKEELESLRKCLNDERSKIHDLESKLGLSEGERKRLEETLAKSEEKRVELEHELLNVRKEAEQEIARARGSTIELEHNLQENIADREAAEALVTKLSGQVSALQDKLSARDKDLDEARDVIERISNELKEERLRKEAAQVQANELEQQLEDQINTIKRDLDYVVLQQRKRTARCAWSIIRMHLRTRILQSQKMKLKRAIMALREHIATSFSSMEAQRVAALEEELVRIKEAHRRKMKQELMMKRDAAEKRYKFITRMRGILDRIKDIPLAQEHPNSAE